MTEESRNLGFKGSREKMRRVIFDKATTRTLGHLDPGILHGFA